MNDRTPVTERRNDRSRDLDLRSNEELVRTIVADQALAVQAVEAAAASIATVVEAVATSLERGGRLHYVGAGTSGRLGVLDASEIPPTFGASPDLVRGHIAGGDVAIVHAVEDAEDDVAAAEAMVAENVRPGDAVIGLSASGGAAYVVRAMNAARAAGAYVAVIVNTQDNDLAPTAQDVIFLDTGPEILAGSTRLKAGTSQKIALNAISTAVMIRLGNVYDNLMVGLVATNAKLRVRARRLVQALTGLSEAEAQRMLEAAAGRVKIAIVMARREVDAETASALLERERGFLRKLL